jgi:hypothetical protein
MSFHLALLWALLWALVISCAAHKLACPWVDANITGTDNTFANGEAGAAGQVVTTTNVYLIYYGDSWTTNTHATKVLFIYNHSHLSHPE